MTIILGINPQTIYLVETFADINKYYNPEAKTISVGIKDRGSILMGGKNADAAYWYYGKERAQWITSTYYMNDLPAWVENFNLESRRMGAFL